MPNNAEGEAPASPSSRRVLTVGVYDLCHEGHVNRLWGARQYGTHLIVGVQDTPYCKIEPVRSTAERVAHIEALRIADEIIVYESGTDGAVLERVRPEVFVHGLEWPTEADRSRVLEVAQRLGVHVVLLPRTEGVSSRELRNRMAASDRP